MLCPKVDTLQHAQTAERSFKTTRREQQGLMFNNATIRLAESLNLLITCETYLQLIKGNTHRKKQHANRFNTGR